MTYKKTALTPELYCEDIEVSLEFYVDLLGFDVLYERKDEGFAMLHYQGAHLMLDQLGKTRDWLPAQLEKPFGRGVNFQIISSNVEELHNTIKQAGISFFLDIEEKTYLVEGKDQKVLQFIVQDPDGYMLRFQN